MERNHDTDEQRKLVREVVDTIELLRLKRRDQWRDGGHPNCKRFTQEELCDLAYGAYKNMALGRTLRIPSRADLLRIADYLECTIHETNDLLLAAEYVPQYLEPRADEYQIAVATAQALLHVMPVPAYILARGWDVLECNRAYYQYFGLPHLTHFSSHQRNALQLALDTQLPLRRTAMVDESSYQETLFTHAHAFRLMHRPFQRERWYQELLSNVRKLPDFEPLWQHSMRSSESSMSIGQPAIQVVRDANLGIAHHIRVNIITLGGPLYPAIMYAMPADEAGRHVFMKIGCSVTENRWEAALTVGGEHGA